MNIQEKYIITRWLYSLLQEPLMTDEEYNQVTREFIEKGILPDYTSRTWSHDPCPVDLLKKYGYSEYIYDIKLLEKTESISSIIDEDEAIRYYEGIPGKFHLSYKEDGVNLQLTYYNGELLRVNTRGRASDAIDFTPMMKFFNFPKITILGEVRIVGEAQLSNENFAKLKEQRPDLKSQRGSIRSALSREETIKLIDFRAFNIESSESLTVEEIYNTLISWGFKTPEFRIASSYSDVIPLVRALSENKANYGYATDGVVVRTNDGHDIKAVRIFNWSEKEHKSVIVGYEEEASSQYFGFCALIEPVEINGVTIRRVNVTNLKTIVDNDLFPGRIIVFTMRSDAIPVIDIKRTRKYA